MIEVLGMLATVSLWAVYAGLLLQYRKVWQNNVVPRFPKLLSGISMATYIAYIVWGFAIDPVDGFRVAAFVPGAVVMPVLWLQYADARPPWRTVFARAGLAIAGTAVLAVGCSIMRSNLHSLVQPIGVVTTVISISYSVIGIPRQIREIRRYGIAGSSAAFAVIVFAGFVIWFAYGIATHDRLLMASQSLGIALQSVVVKLHTKKPARSADSGRG